MKSQAAAKEMSSAMSPLGDILKNAYPNDPAVAAADEAARLAAPQALGDYTTAAKGKLDFALRNPPRTTWWRNALDMIILSGGAFLTGAAKGAVEFRDLLNKYSQMSATISPLAARGGCRQSHR